MLPENLMNVRMLPPDFGILGSQSRCRTPVLKKCDAATIGQESTFTVHTSRIICSYFRFSCTAVLLPHLLPNESWNFIIINRCVCIKAVSSPRSSLNLWRPRSASALDTDDRHAATNSCGVITLCFSPPGATQPIVGVYFTAFYRALASSRTRLLDHIQRRTTVCRTPLNEWSVRRRDFYLTTHNTHNRQTSMPRVGFEPTIAAGERP